MQSGAAPGKFQRDRLATEEAYITICDLICLVQEAFQTRLSQKKAYFLEIWQLKQGVEGESGSRVVQGMGDIPAGPGCHPAG
jgi:hypothetical protein